MDACEPGQVRKEAAVSKLVHVPGECLARAVQQECHLDLMYRGQVHGPNHRYWRAADARIIKVPQFRSLSGWSPRVNEAAGLFACISFLTFCLVRWC